MKLFHVVRVLACIAALGSGAALAQSGAAPASSSQLDAALGVGVSGSAGEEQVAYAREQVLREAGTALGARAGLSDRSRDLLSVLDTRVVEMDRRYNFNPLVIGAGVLPPVISESRDVVALEATAMRVAGRIYRIDEPARFANPAPTWRDWLYLGLDPTAVAVPTLGATAPQNAAERKLWERVVREAYQAGRRQADAVFENNLALLERAHNGMRRYYELWYRGMVSAPIIASASEILSREDPNTIAVGTTLFRITSPTDFRSFPEWKPLE